MSESLSIPEAVELVKTMQDYAEVELSVQAIGALGSLVRETPADDFAALVALEIEWAKDH